MPHKKNPDVFELVRAKCNHLQSVSNQMMVLTTNLPSGYHRDFQLLKAPVLNAFETIESVLDIFHHSIQQIEVKQIDLNLPKYKYLTTVDSINDLVQNGASFREAYQTIGAQVQSGTYVPGSPNPHTHLGSIHILALDLIQSKYPVI